MVLTGGSPACSARARGRGLRRGGGGSGRAPPWLPLACPRARASSPSAPCPWAAFGPATVSPVSRGAKRGCPEGKGGAPAPPYAVNPRPPPLNQVSTLAAAQPPPPLSSGLGWGDGGRGARPQQRRRRSAQAPTQVFAFCSPSSARSELARSACAHALSRAAEPSPTPPPAEATPPSVRDWPFSPQVAYHVLPSSAPKCSV